MFRFRRRRWLLCGAVLVGVAALNGVVDAKAAPARGAVCVRVGAKALDGVSGRGLMCVQTKARGLRWRFAPTAVTTPTIATSTSATTTVASANVAPRVVSASAVTGNAVITIADMSPDTGVYAVQWVPVGQSFNTFSMYRTTTKTMTVPYLSCTRTYTLRVFVMQENWQMTDGFVNQNVTPHSATFDLTMPACTATAAAAAATATAPAAPVTCTPPACAVGDTGPGGGIVFYVQATGTFPCGVALTSTCKYLEAAPTDQSTGIAWCSDTPGALGTTATAVGTGMANTTTADRTCESGAIQTAADYTNNGKTDWHLPSKDELNQMCKWQRGVAWTSDATVCTGGTLNSGRGAGGFSAALYWSSSEGTLEGNPVNDAWFQNFSFGDRDVSGKGSMSSVRPVRAFGGTLACVDGGVCAVGDTGPGGGIVFYVQADGGTFACGETLASTCKYLEAAPTSGTAAWTDATYVWSGNTTTAIGATAQGTLIGTGLKNTQAMVTQTGGGDTAGRAGTITRAYRGPNNLTDWYLPSKDELNQMCKWQRGQAWVSDATVCNNTGTLNSGTGASGFSTGRYWSSFEADAGTAWLQFFEDSPPGYQGTGTKSLTTYFVRPVRAF